MIWFFVRLICFQLFAILLCAGMTIGTVWMSSIEKIDDAYEREVRSLRLVGIGEDPELRLPVERRAQEFAKAITNFCDRILPDPPPGSNQPRVTSALESGMRQMLNHPWWQKTKPLLRRFLPVAYMRLETYYLISLPLFPLLLIGFMIGQASGKQRIREGYHKRNFLPHYTRYGFGLLRDTTVACTGLVIFPPVVFWVLPVVLISCLMTYLWRAYSIQIV